MSQVAFLLVTCCLEPSRAQILTQVVANIIKQAPQLKHNLTVFDNASTQPDVIDLLKTNFDNVWQSNRNVGYWSAIDWFLETCTYRVDIPDYVFIIESDMMIYDWNKLQSCIAHLDNNANVGSVRLHEYSVANRHLYDKDKPRHDSKRNIWQSHTNKANNKPVSFFRNVGDIWDTSFLTQLPALNRYEDMKQVFEELNKRSSFTELDFQQLYWDRYNVTAILDGGLFHCDPGSFGAKTITGSWTSETELKRTGYQATRTATILPKNEYTVHRV